MRKLFLFFLLSIIVSSITTAQLTVQLKLHNNKFKQAFFCAVYGQKLNVITTRKFAGDSLQFKFSSNIPKGIYRIFMDDSSMVEIVADKDSEIVIETTFPVLSKNIKVLKGAENKTYYNYINFKNAQLNNLNKVITLINPESQKKQSTQVSERVNFLKGCVTYKIQNYADSIINIDTSLFVSKLIKAMLIPNLNFYQLSNSYEKKYDNDIEFLLVHFFDNIDFSDSAMLRTEFIYKTINYYIEKIALPRNVLGFNYANELILKKAKTNKTVYNYVLTLLINLYENTQLEDVYLKLYEDYLLKDTTIVSPDKLIAITKKTGIIKSLKPETIAPNITGIDSTGKEIKLSSIKSNFVLLILWTSETKHIDETIKQLSEIYKKYKDFGIQIYAVSLDTNINKWKASLFKYKSEWLNVICKQGTDDTVTGTYNTWSLPSLYMLDSKRTIVAKPINVDYVKKECEKAFKK